jgi:hypothetical protein
MATEPIFHIGGLSTRRYSQSLRERARRAPIAEIETSAREFPPNQPYRSRRVMPYWIKYQHAFNTTTEQCDGSLGEAQAIAMSSVTSGVADHVEIRSAEGELVDCYPAALWVESGFGNRQPRRAPPRTA